MRVEERPKRRGTSYAENFACCRIGTDNEKASEEGSLVVEPV